MSILCILHKQQTVDTIITKIPKTNFVFVKEKRSNFHLHNNNKKERRRREAWEIWEEEEGWERDMGFFFLLGADNRISPCAPAEHTPVYARVATVSISRCAWCSATWFLPTSSTATRIRLCVVTYMSSDIPDQHIPHPQDVWWCLLLLLFMSFFLLLEVEEDVHFTQKKTCICRDRVETEISSVWCLLQVHFLFVCRQRGRLHVHFLFGCRQRCLLHVNFLFVCRQR